MSICSHQHMNLGEEPHEDFNKGIDFVINPENFFEKMFYGELKGIGVSVHARLIRKDLFNGVVFPEGKLFEDSAVSYLNVMRSKQIAITYKPKYCYVRNKDSIVQRKFDETRLDFIKAEKAMTDAVVEKYPNLSSSAHRRLMYAYMNTLAHAVLSGNREYKQLELELKREILKNWVQTLQNQRVPKKDKFALFILRFGGLPLYTIAFKVFKRNQFK